MELNRAFYELETNASTSYYEGKRISDSWPMMANPWPTFCITGFYLYFVTVLGPKYMKNREPYSLKPVLFLYNLAQVIFSTLFVIKNVKDTYGTFLQGSCMPDTINEETSYQLESLAWYYLISKYVEFLDTVFFILRKKWNQVSFLHVYHHTNMAIFTWVFVKYIRASQLMIISLLNCFVHAVMYGYYLLSSLGLERYLWWKRYITRLQIGQFLVIIGFYLTMFLQGCKMPTNLMIFTICNTISFLILFLLFYTKAYSKKKKVQ